MYTIELKEDTKPYLAQCFPIQKKHEPTLTEEVDTLIILGALKKINNSQ